MQAAGFVCQPAPLILPPNCATLHLTVPVSGQFAGCKCKSIKAL